MEGEGRKCGSMNALMMDLVDNPEDARRVHPPVKPVVIRFVKHQIGKQAREKINPSETVHIRINSRVAFLVD